MTPDIATDYCALVHIKTTGCGDDFPCSRRFLHAHAWRYASVANGCQEGTLRDGVVPQNTPAFFSRCTKESTVDPAEVSKNGRFLHVLPEQMHQEVRRLTGSLHPLGRAAPGGW